MKRLALAIGLLACARAAARDEAWEQRAASLGGRWTARFTYASGDSAVGSIELRPNRSIERAVDPIGLPTNYGIYAVTFPGLGGSPSGNRVPAVVAGFVGKDSVYVFFESDRKTFAMQMRGRLRADSIDGVWSAAQSRGTIASGTFTLARQ